ncbi:hypothetical protein U27_03375 [Candidatus Vecturithrix granuli]|uniref:GTP-binding signal recognition particle n=1 Tax=Vecturithrix granuli TaxID=1499967 RepID=A0A081BVQ8_VECG1|nr:hypothetical protein U27_03375 [Candidatus Vecturithrix granuli]
MKACFEVHNRLGCGFLEAVYQEALAIEFEYLNIPYEAEKELHIPYRDRILRKKYRADFVCYDKIIVEIKALGQLISDHEAQVINALKATDFQLGLLVNFGERRLKYKRLVRLQEPVIEWHE